MASILFNVTCGPENPSRAALAFHVAKAALDEGHGVTLFLAGDAVPLIRTPVLDALVGLGTGKLRELYDAIAATGGKIYLSKASCGARGITDADLDGKPVEYGNPQVLVKLTLEHDRVLSY